MLNASWTLLFYLWHIVFVSCLNFSHFVEILVILITNKNIIWEWNFASRHYHRCMQNEWKDFNTDKICKIAIHHNRYDREREKAKGHYLIYFKRMYFCSIKFWCIHNLIYLLVNSSQHVVRDTIHIDMI